MQEAQHAKARDSRRALALAPEGFARRSPRLHRTAEAPPSSEASPSSETSPSSEATLRSEASPSSEALPLFEASLRLEEAPLFEATPKRSPPSEPAPWSSVPSTFLSASCTSSPRFFCQSPFVILCAPVGTSSVSTKAPWPTISYPDLKVFSRTLNNFSTTSQRRYGEANQALLRVRRVSPGHLEPPPAARRCGEVRRAFVIVFKTRIRY
jgi:hypothetical protein